MGFKNLSYSKRKSDFKYIRLRINWSQLVPLTINRHYWDTSQTHTFCISEQILSYLNKPTNQPTSPFFPVFGSHRVPQHVRSLTLHQAQPFQNHTNMWLLKSSLMTKPLKLHIYVSKWIFCVPSPLSALTNWKLSEVPTSLQKGWSKTQHFKVQAPQRQQQSSPASPASQRAHGRHPHPSIEHFVSVLLLSTSPLPAWQLMRELTTERERCYAQRQLLWIMPI